MDSKNPHAGHRSRMRKRFLAAGYDALYEHELLELLLFYARPVVNTNNIAHALTDEFGSLGKTLSTDRDKLCEVDGMGSSGSLFMKLMYDFGTNYLKRSHSSETLNTVQQLKNCISEQFSDSQAKICSILCLGAQFELIRTITLPVDDITNGSISPKELAAMILKSGAFSICVGLNHGNALPLPNDSDFTVTRIFAELLSAVGITFRDCIIYGSKNSFSMRTNGAFSFR
ncbi:MAG: hypothetical protein K5898_08175 [Ruminococcus sp.]|uniref:JAB domain-containing protein n=1 Tax=Ruminococcus sp. TaxID=41978 RepID=UPI0025F31054|nr:JAB domain-containing protein [Ruminococcus sp.]MCR4795125.1 hypothetical protein [Ruminococcus sp.]